VSPSQRSAAAAVSCAVASVPPSDDTAPAFEDAAAEIVVSILEVDAWSDAVKLQVIRV